MKTFAGYYDEDSIRLASSSGGLFSVLAKKIIENNGIVYGVKMSSDCYSAEFTRVDRTSNLYILQGSKYVQAYVGNTYMSIPAIRSHCVQF